MLDFGASDYDVIRRWPTRLSVASGTVSQCRIARRAPPRFALRGRRLRRRRACVTLCVGDSIRDQEVRQVRTFDAGLPDSNRV
jgi:hypothetical protein